MKSKIESFVWGIVGALVVLLLYLGVVDHGRIQRLEENVNKLVAVAHSHTGQFPQPQPKPAVTPEAEKAEEK